jgi:hypothetical protein
MKRLVDIKEVARKVSMKVLVDTRELAKIKL